MSAFSIQTLRHPLTTVTRLSTATARSLRKHGVRTTCSLILDKIEQKINPQLTSHMCLQADLESPRFQEWTRQLWGHRPKERQRRMHRKLWEWCYIAQALDERGMIAPGRRGLGFAVGTEPLASLFCSRGVSIVATDLATEEARAKGWVDTNQHASNLEMLNERRVCPDELLRKNCVFRHVDMNHVPEDLTGFDFVWSSCSLEHLGSLDLGERFIYRAMDCLKPGGVAVHTTEYNCSSNDRTVEVGGTVLYRQKDIERIVHRLRQSGHRINLDFRMGTLPKDQIVDVPPWGDPHLKLQLGEFVITSIGLIIRKAK